MTDTLAAKARNYGLGTTIGLVYGTLLMLALHGPSAEGIGYLAEQLTGLAAVSLLAAGAFAGLERWRIGRALDGRGSWSGPLLPGGELRLLSRAATQST